MAGNLLLLGFEDNPATAWVAKKPVGYTLLQLQASDGAIGASIQVAHTAYQDFEALARNIARNCKSYRQKTTTFQPDC